MRGVVAYVCIVSNGAGEKLAKMSTNKDQISSAPAMIEAFNLCIKIQNAGLATVFYNLSGHVNNAQIRVYIPEWVSQKDATMTINIDGEKGNAKHNKEQLQKLKDILSQEEYILQQSKEEEAKQKQERLQKYLALKKEFEE